MAVVLGSSFSFSFSFEWEEDVDPAPRDVRDVREALDRWIRVERSEERCRVLRGGSM
jgi:hypothetical protein